MNQEPKDLNERDQLTLLYVFIDVPSLQQFSKKNNHIADLAKEVYKLAERQLFSLGAIQAIEPEKKQRPSRPMSKQQELSYLNHLNTLTAKPYTAQIESETLAERIKQLHTSTQLAIDTTWITTQNKRKGAKSMEKIKMDLEELVIVLTKYGQLTKEQATDFLGFAQALIKARKDQPEA